jgi:phospholipase/carboxylesterase
VDGLNFVHRFIPGSSERTLLLLHGTGGDENDLLDLGRSLDAQASLLSPRGKILENGAPRFFRRFEEGVFDEEDVIFRAKELAAFVDAAAAQYEFDQGRTTVVGYSNGANVAAAMLLLGLGRFWAAILFRAMVPLSKIDVPDLKGLRVLIEAGRFDPIAAPAGAERLAQLCQSAGADVTLEIHPAGHQLIAADLETAREWLAR